MKINHQSKKCSRRACSALWETSPDVDIKVGRPFPLMYGALVTIFLVLCYSGVLSATEYHRVRKGDNLIKIGRQYRISVKELKRINNLKRDLIRVGQKLLVSSPDYKVKKVYYRVKRGDNLSKIGKIFGTSVLRLKLLNNLKKDRIYPKQRLLIKVERVKIAPKDIKITPITSTKNIFYKVKKGETLESVTRSFNISIEEICKANLLGKNEPLKAGQVLIIPQGNSEDVESNKEKEIPILPPQTKEDQIVESALGFLGIPYRLGGSGSRGIDCSSLVKKIYEKAGIEVPSSSYYQFKEGIPVSRSEIVPGDLLFFSNRSSSPGHVGLYLGHGLFIHASQRNRKVVISDFKNSSYFQCHFVGARRYY